MRLRLLTIALLVALTGLVVAPLSTAAAPPKTGSLAVPVTGTFTGVFNLTSFAVNQAGQLVATGTLAGQQVQIPVTNVSANSSCQILDLTLGPVDLDLLGLMVHLDQVHLTITAQPGAGALLGNLLCDIANLLNPNDLATALNGLLTNVLVSVTNLLNVAGTLSGVFNLTNFSVNQGQLFANGTLAGQAVSMPVSTSGSGGSCQILHLVLGPLDLNLLGLMVHLNRVVLDITAQPGPGNLLGNLLCAVANLLNSNGSSTALTRLANLLNQILAAL